MSTILLAAAIGLLVGVVVGTLGAGGGVLTVPALVYLVGFAPHDAATASLVIVGATSLVTLIPHARRGNVRWAGGLVFGAIGVVASVGGAWVAHILDGPVLMAAFSVMLLVVAALMLGNARQDRLRSRLALRDDGVDVLTEDEPEILELDADAVVSPDADAQVSLDADAQVSLDADAQVSPDADADAVADAFSSDASLDADAASRAALSPDEPPARTNRLLLVAVALVVGLLTGLFGVGGGFAAVPALILALGYPVRAAVGTSLLVITVNSAAGLVARVPGGIELDWWPVVAFAVVSTVAGQLGARVSSRISTATLTGIFAVLLAVVAVLTASQAVPDLIG